MLKEVIDYLNLKPGYVVIDATIGGAGHAKEILKRIGPTGRLIGLDADQSALSIAEEELKYYKGSFKLINENFRNLDSVLSEEGIKVADAILFDVGISSYQIEDGSRGFSLKEDARLDMRMDQRLNITAYDIVNKYNQRDLSDIIARFGQERFHNRIAKYIVNVRAKKPIETTFELASLVRRGIGASRQGCRIDPATRTFQALRIAVNGELDALAEGLKKAVSWLAIGGRICVLSFHSLEDRIVKNLFKGYASLGLLKIITKKPLRPSYDEVVNNPRSRSGRLRVGERI